MGKHVTHGRFGIVRIAGAVSALAGLTLMACGDDANDAALRSARTAELAAEFRASQTTVPPGTVPPGTVLPATEPTGVVVAVVALDNTFRPQSIEISVGDEVLWENRGQNEHDVLSIIGDWGAEVVDFQPGDVYAHVFTEPGEYAYYCSIHGNESVGMTGTVIVTS